MATAASQITVACAASAFLLTYVPLFIRGPALFELSKKDKGAEVTQVNMNPRVFQARAAATADSDPLAAFVARGQAAHNNQLECVVVELCACGVHCTGI